MERVYNFAAGPATIDPSVLEKAQKELVCYQDKGMSVMEMSHRSAMYLDIYNETEALLRQLMGIPENYKVLFLQGGATLQFSAVPLNLMGEKNTADYADTGNFAHLAAKEAKKYGEVRIAASSREDGYTFIPRQFDWNPDAAYAYITTNGKAYPCKEDAHRIVKRVRYICYGKTRKQTECDGQTGYTAHILDGIIDKVVRQIFERMKAIPKSEIVNIRYREKMEERKALLKSAKSDYAKAAAELDTLRAEVIKSLRGESAFPQDLLSSLISDCETKCLEVQHTMEAAQAAYDEGQAMLDALNAQYDDIISWADMYDSASMESKKMMVSCLIRRVEVYRDYRLHIDFNIDFEQFSAGLDISAIAA